MNSTRFTPTFIAKKIPKGKKNSTEWGISREVHVLNLFYSVTKSLHSRKRGTWAVENDEAILRKMRNKQGLWVWQLGGYWWPLRRSFNGIIEAETKMQNI